MNKPEKQFFEKGGALDLIERVTYGITEEMYTLGRESRMAYGIAVYADASENGTATLLFSIPDITNDRARLEGLVCSCNEQGLSTVHLRDVVEDFIAG